MRNIDSYHPKSSAMSQACAKNVMVDIMLEVSSSKNAQVNSES